MTSCPQCGAEVEFFKDESSRRCRSCGHKFVNPRMDFGCATYCQYAEQCLGDLPPELLAQKEDLLRDRVALEVKRHFGRDFRRIAHTLKVARYAERLVREEKGNPAVALCAAYLHDTGAGERDDASVAREILQKLGAREELVEEVCAILEHRRHPGAGESVNFKVLHDASLLANLERKLSDGALPPEAAEEAVERELLTDSGRALARSVLLSPAA